MTATIRRRFRFGLRTLFVMVTLLACWLGWELKFVQERRAMLGSLLASGNGYTTCSQLVASSDEHGFAYNPATIPFWRRWLGDEAVESIIVPDAQEPLSKALTLFPEAIIVQAVSGSSWGELRYIRKPVRDRGDFIGPGESLSGVKPIR
jgi:hypothetical protein